MIKYFLTQSSKPGSEPDGRVRAARAPGDIVHLDTVCADIAAKTTLTRADVHGTLCAIEEQIVKHVKEGHLVKFGLLGTFRPVASSMSVPESDTDGADYMKKHPSSVLKGIRLAFYPSKELKDRMNLEARFEKVEAPKKNG